MPSVVPCLRSFRSLETPVALVIDDAHELRDPLVVDGLLVLLRAARRPRAPSIGTRTAETELKPEHEAR